MEIPSLYKENYSVMRKYLDSSHDEICRVWLKNKNELNLLSNIGILRYFWFDPTNYVEIHAFPDASERGYGTAVYSKVKKSESIQTYRVCAHIQIIK